MKCRIFSQNIMQIIDEPARKIFGAIKNGRPSTQTARLPSGTSGISFLALGFISALSFCMLAVKILSGPRICTG